MATTRSAAYSVRDATVVAYGKSQRQHADQSEAADITASATVDQPTHRRKRIVRKAVSTDNHQTAEWVTTGGPTIALNDENNELELLEHRSPGAELLEDRGAELLEHRSPGETNRRTKRRRRKQQLSTEYRTGVTSSVDGTDTTEMTASTDALETESSRLAELRRRSSWRSAVDSLLDSDDTARHLPPVLVVKYQPLHHDNVAQFSTRPDDQRNAVRFQSANRETFYETEVTSQSRRQHYNRRSVLCDMLNIDTSMWLVASLVCLLVSNILFLSAFVTNSWGTMLVRAHTAPVLTHRHNMSVNRFDDMTQQVYIVEWNTIDDPSSRRWYFGLWLCCRDDGICLGTKWPAFYSAARTFGVLALFGHALSFAWIFGHTVEKLLVYDQCTMTSLVSACLTTSVFVIIVVSCYGAMWPNEFEQLISFSSLVLDTSPSLGYSFYLAVVTIPLTTAAGLFAIVDFHGSWKDYEAERQFREYNDDETGGDEVGTHATNSHQSSTTTV